ncbi:hypothetical protein PRIPAC_85646, partial [Pristionchus pacificus]
TLICPSIQPLHPFSRQMSITSLVTFLHLISLSIAHFSQCPSHLTPKDFGIVGVWKSNNSNDYRISDEDLSISNKSLLDEGSKTVFLPRFEGDCPIPLCLLRFDLNIKDDGSSQYEEKLFGGNSISDHQSILCAKEEGDCGADSPIYVHSRQVNGSRVTAYSLNGITRIDGFNRESIPLCYAWTKRSSVISHQLNSSNQCIEMRSIENGKIRYTSESSSGLHSVGSSASLLCSSGFVSTGHSYAVCTGNGWYPTNGMGPCLRQPISSIASSFLEGECSVLNEISNGRLVYSTLPKTNRVGSGSTVSLLCNLGFAPAGETSSTCIDGTWVKTLSECFEFSTFKCLPPFPIANGRISYFFPTRMAFSHGSHIQLECMEGFHLEGRDLLTCTNQGWNPPQLGTCTQSALQCPILSSVIGGKVSYTLPLTPTAQGSTAVLVCSEGTVPHGSLSSLCLNGKWTTNLGSCGSSSSSVNTTGINCLPIPAMINGRISYSLGDLNGNYPPGTIASPSCLNGLTLYSGAHLSMCLPSGQWSTSTLGNCGPGLPNECPEFNGTDIVINYNLPTGRQGFRRESTIGTLSCSNGQTDGNVVSTCVQGKWEPPFGQCVIPRQKCTLMSTPIGGSLQYSNGMVKGPFPSGVLVKLTCATSTLQGASIAECRDGQWITENGSSIGNCGQSSSLLSQSGNGLSDSIIPSSTHSTILNDSGGLDGDNDLVDGSSRVVNSSTSSGRCLPIIIPIGATLSYSTPPNLGIYNGGTIVSLNCPGSTPIGSSQSQCSNGIWSPTVGRCALNGEPAYLGGSTFGGNTLGGLPTSSSSPFGINGQSINSPNGFNSLQGTGQSCTMSPTGGTSFGSFPSGTTLTLQCPLGSSITGSQMVTCNSGRWTQMGSCSQPGESLRLDENDIVTFCVPFGSTDRNGMDNGEFRYSNEISGRVSIGTVVRVNCSLGYRVEGASASVCTSNNWKPSTIGRCIQDIGEFTGVTSCNGAPLVLNGQIQYSSMYGPYPIGSYARLICNPGYSPYGTATLTCISGIWSPQSFGVCVMGGNSVMVGGGSFLPQTTQPWTSTTQQPMTTERWTTFPSTTTTTSIPMLTRNCFVPPLTPLQGSLKYSSGNVIGPWNEGVIVALICTNGYHVEGAGAASCRSGSFSPSQLGSCSSSIGASRLPCPSPLTPLNGQFNFSTSALPTGGYPDGAMVALFCQLSTIPYISTCSNSRWYPSIPVSCIGMQRDSPSSPLLRDMSLDCASLRAPPFGEITFSLPSDPQTINRYPSSTRAVLLCTSGTSLEGNREAICINGIFSPPLGMCI